MPSLTLVERTPVQVAGSLDGDWVRVQSGGGLLVWDWEEPLVFVDLHGVRRGGDAYFDIDDAYEAPAPRLNVSPASAAGRPLTLVLPEGEWEVQFKATGPIQLRMREVQGVASGNRFDLDIYYAARETGDLGVREAVEQVRQIYQAHGLSLERVTEHRLPDEARDRFGEIERGLGTDDLRLLLAETRMLRAPSVPVFLVRSLGGAAAVTGSTPGTWGIFGEGATGVVIAMDTMAGRDLGLVLAHEIGHYFGLVHTSERDGQVIEAFEDTVECRQDRDLDAGGTVTAEECPEGAENLMHWAATGTSLSPQQAAWLHAVPLLY